MACQQEVPKIESDTYENLVDHQVYNLFVDYTQCDDLQYLEVESHLDISKFSFGFWLKKENNLSKFKTNHMHESNTHRNFEDHTVALVNLSADVMKSSLAKKYSKTKNDLNTNKAFVEEQWTYLNAFNDTFNFST